ncbi:helix-turn-helix domain-containing protein [Burkholderia catarinensis]|uniref:helix-turn-helix domain-containing protein n=1 Tax=Burkholderia catarinensis TaxID=1108140 RepID=UPI0010081278|nr:helix-turn-helix domain-containing protein [Burkholderia catarinensis]KAG8148557.1 hypothetical protein BFF94_037245 [Burkholderia catarinensis]
MEKIKDGVLYVYRCPACDHRGEVRHPDDRHDGAATTCAKCYGPVTLEWDGGVTLEVAPCGPAAGAPTAAELVHLRERHGRTQAAVAERLGVTTRQVQRWEAGLGAIPIASWQLLCREWGTRFREDFTTVSAPTWGWDAQRDVRRDTIERGDVVHLQAVSGPRIQATVCIDRIHDHLADEHAYGAIVTGIVAAYAVGGPALEGFVLGERVTFARANVIHLEQRATQQETPTMAVDQTLTHAELLADAQRLVRHHLERADADMIPLVEKRKHQNCASGVFLLWADVAERLASRAGAAAVTEFEADKTRLGDLLDRSWAAS